ncbi:DNA/RNA non-specific endonuclease [Plantibacter sp. CFBP 13570]|uniref:DNA/RNA non-specific endonuclease n=1 Tax=Plantibacter sp. CFBP 13570 TaxID=2775272 RepID=UPI001930A644|nr:DNA/RNA non-specific endonuclease [Plantibacter sp. CFBP 13570]MBD8536737.1 DNA/RNA non-specific endonuclease [Plantibacter sp. CFBP 13570]
MTGFDSGFLDLADQLQLPAPADPAELARLRRLDYTHFTVLLDPERRLAAATGVDIDGAALLDLGRGDDWHLDDRVPVEEQAGPELYARNDLDRGHLVRRRDPVWGPVEIARQANVDTFCYTNAAPQAADFNQSLELWNGLEDLVLEYASAGRRRLSVFTGPVFADTDPLYRGVQIPRQFWKVAAWSNDGALAASGYLLDQSAQLDDLDLGRSSAIDDTHDATAVPPLGPFRTFQLPILDLASVTGLDFGALASADVLEPAPATVRPDTDTWIELSGPSDLRF